jgi:hypothetical protein
MKDHDSAYPLFDATRVGKDYGCIDPGMTLHQYAAIHLKVPMSGDPEIDRMIRESRRLDLAGQAVAGLLAGDNLKAETSEGYARRAYGVANALLAGLDREAAPCLL